jgi:hypothetical protein
MDERYIHLLYDTLTHGFFYPLWVKMSQHSASEDGTLRNGTFPNGTLQNGMLQNGSLQNGTVQSCKLQNSAALQNSTDTKRYKVLKRYMLQNDLLQKWYCYKTVHYKNTDIIVGYIPAHYSHNQQGSTNPRIDWALSLT